MMAPIVINESAKLKAGQCISYTWISIKSTTAWYLNLSKRLPSAPEIIKINAEGKKINSLEEYAFFQSTENKEFQNVVGQDSLTRFDKKKKKRKFKAKAVGKWKN